MWKMQLIIILSAWKCPVARRQRIHIDTDSMARKKTGLSVHRTIMIMGSGFISIIALLFIGCAVQRDSSLRLDPCYVIQQTLSNREFLKESSLKIFGIDSIIIIDRKDFLRLCKIGRAHV